MQRWFRKGIASFPFYEDEHMSVEWWDGIGGQMVLARQRQAAVGKPRGTGAQKKAGSRGTAKLGAAAVKTLEENSDKIARSLLESTLGGNVNSAKLLFSLAEGQEQEEREGGGKKKCLRSRADELAAEQEWDGEVMEATAETSFGQREPED
ncbi:MAG: hypothetical protein ACLQKY_16875 [Terracidiphilus sp.]